MEHFKVSVAKFRKDCRGLAEKIIASKKKYHSILGIPRGGTLVAFELSHHLDLPIVESADEHTLLVDDLVDCGATLMNWGMQFDTGVQEHDHDKSPREEMFMPNCAVLYAKPHSPKVEFVQETLKSNDWIEFFYEDTEADMQRTVQRVIEYVGENPRREGLVKTPERVVRMWGEIFGGYKMVESDLFQAVFTSEMDEMVVVKDIPFYSHCEHHLVPFIGKAHIGYIPKGKVLGLSKFARLVEMYSRRMQIQEVLTEQIANAIDKNLKPQGVMVVMMAEHLCMSMRGVKKPGALTVTSVARGAFKDQHKTRDEFMRLVSYGRD